MSLFDTQDLAEITHPDYPGERLIACRNPALAAERARKRQDLLAATEKLLAAHRRPGHTRHPGRRGQDRHRGRQSDHKYKMGKHFHPTITDTGFTYHRDQPRIDAEAALDGIYVLRTSVDSQALDPAAVVESYKNLANIERDFRIIKSDDLDLRPIHHRLDDRVKAHVLICMLACYLIWHLRKAWAPMTFTDEHPPQPGQSRRPRKAFRRRPRQSLQQTRRRRQPATQLPRPARPPGHPHPQPDPLPRHQHRNPHTHRAHPRPTPRLRPPQHPHPTHRRRVARTTTHPNR